MRRRPEGPGTFAHHCLTTNFFKHLTEVRRTAAWNRAVPVSFRMVLHAKNIASWCSSLPEFVVKLTLSTLTSLGNDFAIHGEPMILRGDFDADGCQILAG